MTYGRYLMAVGSALTILQGCVVQSDESGSPARSHATGGAPGSGGSAGSPSTEGGPSGRGGSAGSTGSTGSGGTNGSGGAGGSNGTGGSAGAGCTGRACKADASVDARVADTGGGTMNPNDATTAVEGSADDPFAMYRQPCVD